MAKVTFEYDALQEDELALSVGDIIKNVEEKDVGWCEGELNGKSGMFPSNFVEFIDPPTAVEQPGVTPGKIKHKINLSTSKVSCGTPE